MKVGHHVHAHGNCISSLHHHVGIRLSRTYPYVDDIVAPGNESAGHSVEAVVASFLTYDLTACVRRTQSPKDAASRIKKPAAGSGTALIPSVLDVNLLPFQSTKS